ncbi:type II toxin-antitoxin system VapC family toxin [Sandarakinorhabdus sp.]|uniref:type II toxin-antitoxin system VapC family toxin n=1 Tax=Sandarakinorhabdus sp. TaxID=1916663 RepID=UPI00286E62C3|nr:type II toxin-antitoxin system VapC family toxin [Sandarakinorhabdus sp.]
MTSPRWLLDSNIGIYLLQGNAQNALRRLNTCPLGSVVTSSICLAEMLIGLRAEEADSLDRLLTVISVLPFDDPAAHAYATLRFRRASYDRLIAAHAWSRGLTVVTANPLDFADVPGLAVEDWMQP